jgi:large repetitive protein
MKSPPANLRQPGHRIFTAIPWAIGLGLGLALALSAAAGAYWVVSIFSGANGAEATAQTLPTGATPTVGVSPASNPSVSISFAQSVSSGGTALTAYNVTRYLLGSSSGTSISGSCISGATVTCSDAPGAGTWLYTDIPAIGTHWVGLESLKSTAVVVEAQTTISVSGPSSGIAGVTLVPASATLSNGAATFGGTVTFTVFGPQAVAPTSCTGGVAAGTASVSSNGTVTSNTGFTPTVAGTYWWMASYGGNTYNTASNSGCAATSTVVHLAVGPTTLPAITVYQTGYSQTMVATGGTSPYTYALTSGAFPAGLSISSAGIISGTVTAAGQNGTYSVTFTATDHAGLTGVITDSLTVNPPVIGLAVLTPANPTGDATWAAVAGATGGVGPYSYALTSGALPSGLTLNTATGGFSGTESGPGTFTFGITATDVHGYVGLQAYTVTVISPLITVSPVSPLPVGIESLNYTDTFSSAGGIGPYSYAVTSGSLPSGLSLSSTGVLSGSASATGIASFTVTSTDVHTFTGSTSYSLTIVPILSASRIGHSGTVSCGISLGACSVSTTSSMTTAAAPTTELVVAYFTSTALLSSVSATVTGPFTSVTAVGPNAFTSSALGTSELFEWTAKGNGTTSAASVTFSGLGLALSSTAALDVVQLSGDSTTTPVAQSVSSGTGNSGTATTTFGAAPTQGDGSIIFVGALTASTFTTPTGATPIDVPATTGLFGLYLFDPATQTQNVTLTSGHWGTIGVEFNHG